MSVLSNQLEQLWKQTPTAQAVFTFLCTLPRGGTNPDPAIDGDLKASIGHIFSADYELFTLSYAEALRLKGAESGWPNDVELTIAKSSGAPAVGSRPAIPPRQPVTAYWIPGSSGRKALVIGGVHGSEQSGIEVVEQLHQLLTAPGTTRPLFTTLLVPSLFPSNRSFDQDYRKAHPKVRKTNGNNQENGRYIRVNHPRRGMILVEPNRNYPLPGQSGEDARKSGLSMPVKNPGAKRVPLEGPNAIDYMLPETAGLVTLIEQFQPERIASVHSHQSSSRQGDAQGIFVDPRGGVDRDAQGLATRTRTPEGLQDDELTRKMLAFARSIGGKNLNPKDDIHYSEAPNIHPVGTSLGGWAPVAEARAGGRPAATILTLEVENYWPSTEDPTVATRVNVYAKTLQSVFLESSP